MVEDQSESSMSNTITNSRLDNRFIVGEVYALKARKPYTITKQREKWTQDEHRRFLEALKLYGRSWRQIEEHVGNRTAVQIRSHAQKFFSKVVRESSCVDEAEKGQGPIEIPPPRAKRKPTRPYPRKALVPFKKRTTCHGSSRSSHENMSSGSPKSLSTRSLKLFGKTFFIAGCTSPSSVDTLTTLPWKSMPTLGPGCKMTQCCSHDSEKGEYGDEGERCAKGFVPYNSCLAEESSMLTCEEREEIGVTE
ncbi:protein REVEILLE 2-like [Bidens hawaiensis]|uniref:protein REVEILLE 2-like n=1 Tax=Bidens hawaiensis TaxID=980011 RepID=UPI004049EF55